MGFAKASEFSSDPAPHERPLRDPAARAALLTDLRLYLIVGAVSLASSLGGVLIGRGPIVNGGDEFAYLLGAQTFSAGRLTNPTHPHWEFFESFHVLMTPSYMAKYPPAQSLVLALGYKLGHPIIGVWLTGAAFALATTWLVRARFAARWALLGGVLVVLQFGGTHYYTQSYWGGAVAATGGSLIIGSVLRLGRTQRARNVAFLGLGIAISLLSRPFETVLLFIVPAILLIRAIVPQRRESRAQARHILFITAPLVLAALVFQAQLNHAVTGDWKRLPYLVYESQYSGAPLFVWQAERPMPEFRNPAMATFYINFVVPWSRFDSPLVTIWAERLYIFFQASLGLPMAFVAVLGSLLYRTRTIGLIWSMLATSSVGFVLSYWSFPHYHAGVQGACVFLVVHALRAAYVTRRAQRRLFAPFMLGVLAVCGTARAIGDDWRPSVGHLAYARREIIDRLQSEGGRHLIFVRRVPPYDFHFIWIYNEADIDGSTVAWAHDRGAAANRKLIDYYNGSRRVWLLVDSNDRPRLVPFDQPR